MSNPTMDWGSQDPFAGLVVWWSRVDGRYQVEVSRKEADSDEAVLRIYDHERADELVAEKDMGHLSYGAVFGPDVDDVARFQDECLRLIDSLPAQNGAS